jgi:hypothetical protein
MAQEQREQRMQSYRSLHTTLNNVILCIKLKRLAEAEKLADRAIDLLMRVVELERDA